MTSPALATAPTATPADTQAIVVGIEKYVAPWDLLGPASDAVRFAAWLIRRGVPAPQIRLFLSPLEALDAAWLERCGVDASLVERFPLDEGAIPSPEQVRIEQATSERLVGFLTEDAPALTGKLLLLFWGGHGIVAGDDTRRLFCAEATANDRVNFDVANLLRRLRSPKHLRLRRQIWFVDACANRHEEEGPAFPARLLEADTEVAPHDQMVVFAASKGQFAENDSRLRTGIFTRELMAMLAESTAWPPDVSTIVRTLVDRVQTDHPEQLPEFFWTKMPGEEYTTRGGLGAGQRSWSEEVDVPVEDWSCAPDSGLAGVRASAVSSLAELLARPEAPGVVAVTGLPGTGKTSLTTSAARAARASFDDVVWRSLRHAPPAAGVLEDLVRTLGGCYVQPDTDVRGNIERVLRHLRRRRTLLVLTHGDDLFADSSDGGFAPGCEGYLELLRGAAEDGGKGCIAFTSGRDPTALIGRDTFVWYVPALTVSDARLLLAELALQGSDDAWQQFVDRYSGNVATLRIVAATVRDAYGGELSAYLQKGRTPAGALDAVRELLDHLTSDELDIVLALALAGAPLDLLSLARRIDAEPGDLQEAIAKLHVRSILVPDTPGLALPHIVTEAALDRLAAGAREEIISGTADPVGMLSRHAFVSTLGTVDTRNRQRRIVVPAIIGPWRKPSTKAALHAKLSHLLDDSRVAADRGVSHVSANVATLLASLDSLGGANLANLELRDVDFLDTDLRDADLRGSDLTGTLFRDDFTLVLATAFDPKAPHVIAGIADGTVRIWSTKRGALERIVHAHRSLIWAMDVSADGSTIATASDDGTVALVDVATGEVIQRCVGHEGWVRAVAFDRDGARVASGGADGTVRVWDAKTGECLRIFPAHHDLVWAVMWHPLDDVIASGSKDGSVSLLSPSAELPIAHWTAEEGRVLTLAFNRDGTRLATGGDSCEVRVWSVPTGERLHTLRGHTQRVWSVAYSPDGETVASAGEDRTVRLWNDATRTPTRTLFGHENWVRWVAFSPMGSKVVTGSDDHTARVWDVATGTLEHTRRGYSDPVVSLAFTPGGERLLSGCSDSSVRAWAPDGTLAAEGRAHSNKVWCVACAGDGQFAASAGDDGTVRLWDPRTLAQPSLLTGSNMPVWSIAFAPDGNRLASSGEDGVIRLWQVPGGALVGELEGHGTWVRALAFDARGARLASGGDDQLIRVWDSATDADPIILTGHSDRLWSVAFAHEGELLASASDDGTVRLWDVASGTHRPLLGHDGCVWAVAFSPDERLVASAGSDHTVRVWDVSTGAQLSVGYGHTGWVRTVAFAPDGRLASGSLDGSIRWWEAATGVCVGVSRKDRPYERMRIAGATGITAAQRVALIALGARDD